MKIRYKIFVIGQIILMLLMTGCIQEEQQDGTDLAVGTLRLQITDKPGDLDILYANVTISTIQVHKSNATNEDDQKEEPYENTDEYDDNFIADANGPYTGEIEVDIQFYGDATGGNGFNNWSWDFGDGGISYEQNPIHNYSANGTYPINLTVTDDNGSGISDWYLTTATIGEDDDNSGSEAGWITIIEEAQTFDLIALQNVTDLLGMENITIGKYTQIRLTVDSALITINNSNKKEEHDLKIPSNKVKLIKPFWIYEDKTTTLTLDFDVYESVHKTGSNKYMMKPTIKII
jgi:hypothetical protein